MRPDKPKGKILLDLENEQGLECLITKSKRLENRGAMMTETLIDVLHSKKPELFKYSGNYYPSLSDHALIYCVPRGRLKGCVHRLSCNMEGPVGHTSGVSLLMGSGGMHLEKL